MRTRGFTLIELLIVIGVVSILFAIAVPWLLNARMSANEASAISSLEAITHAQALYKEVCGKGRYAASLPALAEPPPATGVSFLSPDLTSGEIVVKNGYQILLRAEAGETPVKGCNDADTVATYVVTADPLRPGNSGRRYFATNGSRVLYEHTETLADKMPDTGPPPVGTELR
jgi:prepilin-type N-terminal cleavage/methylation domain-containing protein